MKYKVILFAIFLFTNLLIGEVASLDSSKAKRYTVLDEKYLKNYYKDPILITKSVFSSTDARDYILCAGLVTVGAALYFNDDNIYEKIQNKRNDITDDISYFLEKAGNGLYQISALTTTYLYGYYSSNSKLKETSLLGIESFALSGIFAQMIKISTHRSRPYQGYGSKRWFASKLISTDNVSFPSGHTTSIFSLATVVSMQYDKLSVSIPAYTLASLVALSRVHDKKHWASDVFAGAVLGHFIAKMIVNINKKRNSLSIVPIFGIESTGIGISYKF